MGCHSHAAWRMLLSVITLGALLIFGAQASEAGAAAGVRLYKMSRPAISVTMQVRGHHIGFLNVQAKEQCVTMPFPRTHPVERFEGAHGFSVNVADFLPVHDGGRFVYREHGNGFQQQSFSGQINGDRVTGIYRGWYIEMASGYEGESFEVPPTFAEHYGEEYRCGTIEPHGLPVHFTARLVKP
jgi:hypothetical protein